MSLADFRTSSAAERPDKVTIKLDDVEVSYGMLDNATARVATLLRSKGVEVGDRVGVMLPNVPHFPIVFFGAQRAGAVVVPMNVLLKGREVGFYLEDSGAKLLLAWSGFAEAAEERRRRGRSGMRARRSRDVHRDVGRGRAGGRGGRARAGRHAVGTTALREPWLLISPTLRVCATPSMQLDTALVVPTSHERAAPIGCQEQPCDSGGEYHNA